MDTWNGGLLFLPLSLLIISWLPVMNDCRGAPEIVSRYEVVIFEVRVIGSHTGPDGKPWPTYSRSFGPKSVVTPSLALIDPQPGEIIGWDGFPNPPAVVAIDDAGMRSDVTCR